MLADFVQDLIDHARKSGALRNYGTPSTPAREAVVSRLTFLDEYGRADLLDPARTTTQLIEALACVLDHCPRPIMVTSVRTDHRPDGPGRHSHNPGGDAIDVVPADRSVGDAAFGELLAAVAAAARAGLVQQCGLGGVAKNWNPGGWPPAFDLFDDNDQDHVHFSAALAADRS
jgi:hypothetical protein